MTTEVARATDRTPATTAETTRPRRLWRPPTDIIETREGVTLMVEMPGVAAEDVEVTLEKRVLTIRGRATIAAPENLRPAYAEYEPGDYERVFTLSEDFDADRIAAEMKHGVLVLRLPRAAVAGTRTIAVKAA